MNEMTSDIIKFCQILLPRCASFVVWVLMPRAVPTADGVCPFRAQVGAKRGDWECVKLWLGALQILRICQDELQIRPG